MYVFGALLGIVSASLMVFLGKIQGFDPLFLINTVTYMLIVQLCVITIAKK